MKNRIVWFTIGALAVLAFPSVARGEWPVPVFYGFAALFFGLAAYGLVSGRVYVKNPREVENKGWCYRSQDPLYYWGGIALYAFAAAAIVLCLQGP